MAIVKYDSKTNQMSVKITLDADKGLFFSSKLDYDEIVYLTNHKYVPCNFVPVGKTRQEEVYVLPSPPESLIHTFLVRNIYYKILRKTKKVRIYKSFDADIVFENNKKQTVALEIETGKGFKKHKERLINKFHDKKEKYGKNLYIILTDSNMKRKYKSLFPKIKILMRKDLPQFIQSQLR